MKQHNKLFCRAKNMEAMLQMNISIIHNALQTNIY